MRLFVWAAEIVLLNESHTIPNHNVNSYAIITLHPSCLENSESTKVKNVFQEHNALFNSIASDQYPLPLLPPPSLYLHHLHNGNSICVIHRFGSEWKKKQFLQSWFNYYVIHWSVATRRFNGFWMWKLRFAVMEYKWGEQCWHSFPSRVLFSQSFFTRRIWHDASFFENFSN